jgi:predicted RNA-binding protein with RPS1 domain
MATIGQMNVKLNLDATGALKALEESKSKLADVGRESSRQMKIIGANLGEATAKMSLNASASEVLAVKQQALTSKVEEQRKYVAALSDAYQKSVAALVNNADETGKLELRMAKAKETEAKLEQQLRQTTQEMQKQSTESSNLSSKMESSFKKLKDVGEKMSVGVTAPLVGFTAAATEGTEELRTELSKLDANARRESASIEQVNNLYRDMYAITGELDSNTEAFSNLLKSGFKGDALKQVTEQLAGASLMFKDTLKFEGLGDGLQETLGTLNAVGPFAELLERLGLNLNTFNAGLKEAAANGTQTQYVLDVLAKQGLANNYKEYVKNNQALVENKKSTYDLMVSMSEFAKAATPVFTNSIK